MGNPYEVDDSGGYPDHMNQESTDFSKSSKSVNMNASMKSGVSNQTQITQQM